MTSDEPTIPYHWLANLQPMMSDAECESLKASIATDKQTDPGKTFQGMLIDGRNRERACRALGIDFKHEEFEGTFEEAFAYVCAKGHHRHLSDSQKACVAANFLDAFEAERKYGRFVDATGKSRDYASMVYGVNPRYVQDARKLKREHADAFDHVFVGKVKLTEAFARLRHSSRAKAVRKTRESTAPTPSGCRLIHGDNVAQMTKLPDASARVIFADPPYNNGWAYRDDPHADRLDDVAYMQLMEAWMEQAHRLLTDDGSLFAVIDDRYVCDFGMSLKSIGFHFRRLIVWHETFANYPSAEGNLPSGARFIHYFSKTDQPLFNTTELRVPSRRQSTYNDPRANPDGRLPDSVWQISRITGNNAERVPWQDSGQAPQLPISVPERCILLASEPFDLVLDPFNGNGTTGIAALRNRRKYIGIDRDAVGLRRSEQWINSQLADHKAKQEADDASE